MYPDELRSAKTWGPDAGVDEHHPPAARIPEGTGKEKRNNAVEKMDDTPFVSVVIATYNRKGILKECLEALFNQSYSHDCYEIIVVDDESSDDTLKMLKEYSVKEKNLRVFTQKNQGRYVATNLGIANCRGDIICTTDDDCIADREWIKNLVEGYANGIGAVGGRICSYDYETVTEKYCKTIDLFDQKNSSSIFLMTGNASFRREVIEKLGGFDTDFRYGGDLDMGLRVRLLGYKMAFNPQAFVYHKHMTTLKSLIRQKYRHGRGYARIHKKYPNNFYPHKQILSLMPIALRGVIVYPVVIVKSFYVKDRYFYLIKRLFDIILIIAYLTGMSYESLFGASYKGQKIHQRLEYIEKGKMSHSWGL